MLAQVCNAGLVAVGFFYTERTMASALSSYCDLCNEPIIGRAMHEKERVGGVVCSFSFHPGCWAQWCDDVEASPYEADNDEREEHPQISYGRLAVEALWALQQSYKRRSCTITELAKAMKYSPQTVRKWLSQAENEGLIMVRKEGSSLYYRARKPTWALK